MTKEPTLLATMQAARKIGKRLFTLQTLINNNPARPDIERVRSEYRKLNRSWTALKCEALDKKPRTCLEKLITLTLLLERYERPKHLFPDSPDKKNTALILFVGKLLGLRRGDITRVRELFVYAPEESKTVLAWVNSLAI
ncbi:MAG: hypothetical protein V3R64_07820 [Sphingomonadales bacterium]